MHVCEQAHWARTAGNSAIENVLLLLRKTCKLLTISFFCQFYDQNTKHAAILVVLMHLKFVPENEY